MSYLVPVVSFLFVLGVLVAVHEAGHFLVAKLGGIGVVEFAIGFGPLLFSRVVGETRYSLRAVPFGGFVRMVGDDPRAVGRPGAPPVPDGPDGAREATIAADRSRWFLTKPYPVKAAVVVAGPLFNILLALVLSVGLLLAYGQITPNERPVVGGVVEGQPAALAGIKEGDEIVSVDGKPMRSWSEMASTVRASGGRPVSLVVRGPARGGAPAAERTVVVTPEEDTSDLAVLEGRGADAPKTYLIGVHQGEAGRTPVTLGEAIPRSAEYVYKMAEMNLRGIWHMILGNVSARNIGGPLMIFQETNDAARRGFESVLNLMIVLSVMLAVLNLLPVPLLDGGHLLIFTIEAIKGGPLSATVQERAQQVGMVLLLALMVFAMGNDLSRLLGVAG